jgi:hypothetical protein
MSLPRALPTKKEVALMLLESSDVFIHLDPRKEPVVVPQWLRKQPHLILQVGLNMPVPIPDLQVDDDGITCTLSFNRSPFWCKLPWVAVYALVSKDARGMVWPDDVPPEVAMKFAKQDEPGAVAPEPVGQPAPAVQAAAEPQQPPVAEAPAARPSGKGRKASTKGRKRQGATAEVPPAAKAAPAPAAAPAAPPRASKPKRELPPYLRVVK